MKNSLLVPKALLKSSWLLVVLLVFLSACVGPVAAPQPGVGSPEASSGPAGESQAYPATAVPTKEESAQAQAAETSPSPEAEGPSQRLDPLEIQKYSTPLFIMPVMLLMGKPRLTNTRWPCGSFRSRSCQPICRPRPFGVTAKPAIRCLKPAARAASIGRLTPSIWKVRTR